MEQELKKEIRKELQFTELVLWSQEKLEEDYQIRMIRENEIPGMLMVNVSGVDQGSEYTYDISGMHTLIQDCDKRICDVAYMNLLLSSLLKLIAEMNNYMLDMNGLLLEPEYVFVKNQEFRFCYCPEYKGEITTSFHGLTEFLVKVIDYGDYDSVIFACGLHKETLEVPYNLFEIIEKFTREKGGEKEGEMAITKKPDIKLKESDLWGEEETPYLAAEKKDGIVGQELEVENPLDSKATLKKMKNVIKETPLKKYWNQKKKERWGIWDDLLLEEESSIMNKKNE